MPCIQGRCIYNEHRNFSSPPPIVSHGVEVGFAKWLHAEFAERNVSCCIAGKSAKQFRGEELRKAICPRIPRFKPQPYDCAYITEHARSDVPLNAFKKFI